MKTLTFSKKYFLLVFIFSLQKAQAQDTLRSTPFSTKSWLEDATTVSFQSYENRKLFKNTFNGLRFIFEPQFGRLIQSSVNRINEPHLLGLGKIGLESNLYKGFVSLQGSFIYPSRVQYDEQSMYRRNGNTLDSLGWVDVDFGLSLGLTFFDGIFSFGFATVFFDKRDYINTANYKHFVFQNNFFYINLQPISLLKLGIKEGKKIIKNQERL